MYLKRNVRYTTRTTQPAINKDYMDIDLIIKNNGDFRGKRSSANQKFIFSNKSKHGDIRIPDSHNTNDSKFNLLNKNRNCSNFNNSNTKSKHNAKKNKTRRSKRQKEISNVEQTENSEEPEFSFEELQEIYDKELNYLESSTKEEESQLITPNVNNYENTLNTLEYNPNEETV